MNYNNRKGRKALRTLLVRSAIHADSLRQAHLKAHRWTVIGCFALLSALFVTGMLFREKQLEWTVMAIASEQLEHKNEQVEQLVDENQALKIKLERLQQIQTSQSVKDLTRFYIHKYFPQSEWDRAERIATCESNMNPGAFNGKNTNGTQDRGIFQINSGAHKARFEKFYGVSYEVGAHDYDLNVQYAKFLWDHSGWNPWVCRKILGIE